MVFILNCCLLASGHLDALRVFADDLTDLILRCCFAAAVGFLRIRFELRFEPAPWARKSGSR